ncbi:hypothetical protein WG66_007447 [Moniliophthora roreri]|nr:hypothetical protein WG66_007447 [Moniliophthora roreri]
MECSIARIIGPLTHVSLKTRPRSKGVSSTGLVFPMEPNEIHREWCIPFKILSIATNTSTIIDCTADLLQPAPTSVHL